MKSILSTSEIIGTAAHGNDEVEVCATGEADYEETQGRLLMVLDSFLRPVGMRAKERRFRADWLPATQRVQESVCRPEAPEMARDIFHRWVGKVRQAVPALSHR